MHPAIQRNPRLRKLFELDEKIGATLLGHPPEDRSGLLELRNKVRTEIKTIMTMKA